MHYFSGSKNFTMRQHRLESLLNPNCVGLTPRGLGGNWIICIPNKCSGDAGNFGPETTP